MARQYSPTRRKLPGNGEVELEDRPWQVLLVVASSTARDESPTTEQVARRCGISYDWANQILHGLPGRVVERIQPRRGFRWRIAPRYEKGVADRADELVVQLRRANKGLRLKSRKAGKSKSVVLQRIIAEAERAMFTDIAKARRLIQEYRLRPGHVLQSVPKRRRHEARARVADLFVDVLTSSGEPGQAIKVADRVILRPDTLPPDRLVHILGIKAAAERMLGTSGFEKSLQSYNRALQIIDAGKLGAEEKRPLQRWLLSARVSALLGVGRFEEALESLEAAQDLLEDDDHDGIAETNLILAKANLAAGRQDDAMTHLEVGSSAASKGSLWVQGWVPRYRADVAARFDPLDIPTLEGVRRQLALDGYVSAWRSCSGYGFQRKLLLSRLAFCEVDWNDLEVFEEAERYQLRRSISAEHKASHGRPVSRCGSCRRSPLSDQIKHALGFGSRLDWRFFR